MLNCWRMLHFICCTDWFRCSWLAFNTICCSTCWAPRHIPVVPMLVEVFCDAILKSTHIIWLPAFSPSSTLFRPKDRPLIVVSNIGLACMISILAYCTYTFSLKCVIKYYFIPYVVWYSIPPFQFWCLFVFKARKSLDCDAHVSPSFWPNHPSLLCWQVELAVWGAHNGWSTISWMDLSVLPSQCECSILSSLLYLMNKIMQISHDHVAHHLFPDIPFCLCLRSKMEPILTRICR